MNTRVGSLAGLQVLVVDDHRDARAILAEVLEFFGARVTQARTAVAALRELRTTPPDVVVADIELPDHDGAWLLREARHHSSKVPFLAVSGFDLDEAELASQGFEAFLRKPVDHVRLADTVLSLARRGR